MKTLYFFRVKEVIYSLFTLVLVLVNCQPQVFFTSVPPYGTVAPLQGKVINLENPQNYKIAPFIKLSTWWTKPSFGTPTVSINSDGTFTANINTASSDVNAVFIAVFVINSTVTPPQANGANELPRILFEFSHAFNITGRKYSMFFSNYWWHVKDSNELQVGPGNNYFSGNATDVYLDSQNQLHLTSKDQNQKVYCTEIYSEPTFGFGYYFFNLASSLDQIDENLVLGLFTYDSVFSPNYRELDFEFSKWGNNQSTFDSQFVIQPFQNNGNLIRFLLNQKNQKEVTCVMMWSRTKVEMFIYFGKYQTLRELPSSAVKNHSFSNNADIPLEGTSRVHLNLWKYGKNNPKPNSEIVVTGFQFYCLEGFEGRFCEKNTNNSNTFHVFPSLFICFLLFNILVG
jgi:hypothetical protein